MLKRITAILFIQIYLFNLVGYVVLFNYFISQTNQQTLQQLDDGNYNESELMEIKIALDLPYYTSMNEYERFDGEIELNNIHYNFVKRKVLNDTLYLLCLPNHAKTELYKAKREFAANETNSKVPLKKGMSSLAKKITSEKEHRQQFYLDNILDIPATSCKDHKHFFRLIAGFITSLVKPPEIIS